MLTHCEAAASGEAIRIRNRDCASAYSIEGHRLGVADRLVSSRNTRSARRRYQGLPSFCTADCSAEAIGLSLAWLYEMKASYLGAVADDCDAKMGVLIMSAVPMALRKTGNLERVSQRPVCRGCCVTA